MQRGKQVPGCLRQYVDIFVLVQRPSACTHAYWKPPFTKPSAATTRLSLCTEACMYWQHNAYILPATRLFCYTQTLEPDWHQSQSMHCSMPHTAVWTINMTQTKTGYNFYQQSPQHAYPQVLNKTRHATRHATNTGASSKKKSNAHLQRKRWVSSTVEAKSAHSLRQTRA